MKKNDDISSRQETSPSIDIATSESGRDYARELTGELELARRDLREAEAGLAAEQAEVNSFRMHCRLKLDAWIEALSDIQTKRQSLTTRLHLLRQADELGIEYDESDPFWETEEILESLNDEYEIEPIDDDLILPTDTPRDKAAEKRLYRKLVRRFHPDLGVTAVEIAYRTEMMSAVNIAHEQDDIQSLYDLAGELDPNEVAEIAAIQNREIRALRRQLLHCHRRIRRARRRLESLRDENTSRLWQKARYLDESDMNWWEIVRREIEHHIERIQQKETDTAKTLIGLIEWEIHTN
jgi:hypothetical protein